MKKNVKKTWKKPTITQLGVSNTYGHNSGVDGGKKNQTEGVQGSGINHMQKQS